MKVTHWALVKAKEVLSERSFNDYDRAFGKFDQIKRLSKEYMSDYGTKKAVLRNEDFTKFCVVELFNRLHDQYSKRIIAKMYEMLPAIQQRKKFLFVTFTASPRNYYCLQDMYSDMQKNFNRVLTRLRKKYEKRNIQFIKVVEYHKTMLPHLHVLFIGIDWIPEDWIKKLWSIGSFVNLKRLTRGGPKNAFYYALKYVLKSNSHNHFSRIICWALQNRMYSKSRSLNINLDETKNKSNFEIEKWIFFRTYSNYLFDFEPGVYSYEELATRIMEIEGW